MRIRDWFVIGAFLVLAMGAPSAAHAGIIELIDGWSGPGPFIGYGWEWRMACWTREGEKPSAAQASTAGGDEKHRAGVIGPGCFFTPHALDSGRHRVASINMGFGLYKSKRNPLFDGETTTIDGKTRSTTVRLSSIDIEAWWRPLRSLEFGTGGGMLWVGGDTFEGFRRLYFRPALVDLKPFAALHDWLKGESNWGSKDEILTLRVGLHVIPEGFTAAAFGSTKDWRVAREVNPTLAIFFDLDPLFRKHD